MASAAELLNHLAAELPPLESGDRLTRVEFERRYAAMPGLKKAELIEGVVYVPSPVRHLKHGQQHADLAGWLAVYRAHTPHVEASDNATLRLDEDSEPQPDLLLRLDEAAGGRSRVDADGYLVGGPELIAEIASSSTSYDLHQKLRVYRRHRVREYLVWRVLDGAIDWFVLRDGDYLRLEPGDDGACRSEVFAGLWLDVPALLRGDLGRVHQVLAAGLKSEAHAAFAARLQGSQTAG